MDFILGESRNGLLMLGEDDVGDEWREVKKVLESISDEDVIERHNTDYVKQKSISKAINALIKERLTEIDWTPESPIFSDPEFKNKAFRLDFAKEHISIEVAFNHGGDIAWNLIKPVLACELNHVKKAAQTKLGVMIVATDEMKRAGGFDGAIGTYEKVLRYFQALQSQLTSPIVLVGLRAPKTFYVEHALREINGKIAKRAQFVRKE